MRLEVIAHLSDILQCINDIDEFIGNPKLFEAFQKDKKLRRAVEREFEIIGEAINRIKRDDLSVHISNAHSIYNLRNRVIHAYDAVNNEIIWGIIINHLPKLKIEVEDLISKYHP